MSANSAIITYLELLLFLVLLPSEYEEANTSQAVQLRRFTILN